MMMVGRSIDLKSASARRRGVAALVIGVAPILIGGLAAGESSGHPSKVTICHRTASHTNPYVLITVDQNAVDGDLGNDHGRGDHYMEHLGPIGPIPVGEWGDIIPPIAGVHGGRNWTTEGQAILTNACNPAPPVRITTTTAAATTTTAAATTTTAAATTTTAAATTTTTSTTTTAAATTTTTSTTAPPNVLSETITQTPAAAADAAAVDSTSALAATGIASRQIALLGLVLLGAGLLSYIIRRRRS